MDEKIERDRDRRGKDEVIVYRETLFYIIIQS